MEVHSNLWKVAEMFGYLLVFISDQVLPNWSLKKTSYIYLFIYFDNVGMEKEK